MNLDKIKEDLIEYLNQRSLVLYELTYQKEDETLSIILDNKLSMEELENVSNELSAFMDKYEDEFVENYVLDVATVGLEREIRNEEELQKAVGDYIYVKTDNEEYNGDFKSYTDGLIELEVKDKTRIKTIKVLYKDTKQVRYAVKF